MTHIPTAAEFSRAVRQAIPKPTRIMAPVFYYGGKGRLARRLMPYLAIGNVYVEPYCGAASMFWHMEPRAVEVLNDIDEQIVGLFRVLQHPVQFEQLAHRLTWTPYSLSEFRRALADAETDPVSRAWAYFVRHNQGFSGIAQSGGNWSRTFISKRGMAGTACGWRCRLHLLDWWHERLTRVQLDCRDALEVIRYWDSPETVFYLDPPYIGDTRTVGHRKVYATESDDAHHQELVQILLGIQGAAMLSGYEHPIYQPLTEAGWRIERFETACHTAGRTRGDKLRGKGTALKHAPRTECVWIKDGLSAGAWQQGLGKESRDERTGN